MDACPKLIIRNLTTSHKVTSAFTSPKCNHHKAIRPWKFLQYRSGSCTCCKTILLVSRSFKLLTWSKVVGPFSIRYLTCTFTDQAIYCIGPCLFWFVPWSVNSPRLFPQKDLVKMSKVFGPFPKRPCLFWFLPWSVNGPRWFPQKDMVKMSKVLGPLFIRCLTFNFMDQVIFGRGTCLFWLVSWSLNSSRSFPQKDLVKFSNVLGPFPKRCLSCNSMDQVI